MNRIKLTRPYRFQKWGPLKNYHSKTNCVQHSRWRARFGWCRCMGCVLDRVNL